ncbi:MULTISPECIES: restriction endonuclease subunit S [Halomonas]|uniref:restriction endonuclease subunit S n=1 Tax=Halomonas TaxID=2745 RepID=UPI001866539E|nr:restriction endonuclease subunit S [Halomonas casei]
MTDSLQIPEQWLSLLIGEVADVIAGGTPKASDPDNFAKPETQIAWLTPADLSKYAEKYIAHGARDLSAKGYEKCSAKMMPTGTLLFSSRAPIGYVAVAANEISTNQGFKNFVMPSKIEPSYAYYFLRSIRDIAESMGTGTTFKEISGANAKKLPFILPPLAEQKIIADKLDTLLAQVDNTKARLERIPEILKCFRQSVLAAAVTGRLTEEWHKKYSTNHEWQTVSLGHLVESGPQNGVYKPTKLYGSGCLIIRIDSFYDGLIADWKELKRVQLSLSEIEKWQINKGDILVNRVNSIEYLGKSALVKDLVEPVVFESNIMRLSLKRGLAKPEFISLFLRSPVGLEQLRANAKLAVNQASINQNDVKSCMLDLPTLEEQTEIVRRADQLFAYADTVERQVNSAFARVNQLTQSILAKAFRGELTEQWRKDNPALISGENSAKALLARIKEERAAQAPKKRTRKKTTT